MKVLPLPLLAAGALLALVGCSTPATRIRQNPAVFNSLPANERPLVERGIVREGMSQDAVFLAWGRPDAVRRLQRPKELLETWIYLGTDFVPVPGYSYGYLPTRHGRYRVPYYDYNYVPVQHFERSVAFEKGRVIGWEAPVR